ncbi:hypothetical protein EYF80_022283 [Liparis tanakae]|uniref:Uncharacterized protein n=1 Tax=Liparis tanakae TaxID=230148 RepID=A0A4Z2HNX9_9TELE|nr:hypothetical protein EYF80_022283 [Liparis tanakae]
MLRLNELIGKAGSVDSGVEVSTKGDAGYSGQCILDDASHPLNTTLKPLQSIIQVHRIQRYDSSPFCRDHQKIIRHLILGTSISSGVPARNHRPNNNSSQGHTNHSRAYKRFCSDTFATWKKLWLRCHAESPSPRHSHSLVYSVKPGALLSPLPVQETDNDRPSEESSRYTYSFICTQPMLIAVAIMVKLTLSIWPTEEVWLAWIRAAVTGPSWTRNHGIKDHSANP